MLMAAGADLGIRPVGLGAMASLRLEKGYRDMGVDGARVRVTYLGELGWELHIPAEYAAGVFDELTAAGADLGLRPVGLAAMASLRLEKGYRDLGVDIDNTDNPIEAGLGFTIAWDKPGGFVGRDALLEFKAQGPPRNRVVSLLVEDPSADLFGNEPVTVDGEWVGYVRAAAYGYTLGGPVGLASVSHEGGVTADWLREQSFTVHTPGGDCRPDCSAAVLRPRANAHPGHRSLDG